MKTVFVSSTFKDMQLERDEIRKTTAPLLNTEARKYGDEFDFCDLRWGINTSEMDSGEGSKKILDVCLDEIDRCKPPMVVLLGYRYGWIPDEHLIKTAAERKKMQLDDLQKSVTALEIEYGALSNTSGVTDTLFYFREIDGDFPDEFETEDSEHLAKVNKLKERIFFKTGGKIKEYHLKWNGKGFDGVKEFALMLAEDIREKLLPEWEKTALLTPFDRERRVHETFISEKAAMFRARRAEADEIIEEVKHEPVTIIKGEVGSGKSTLFCKIAQEMKQTDWTVLPFISGLTLQSNDTMDIIGNTIEFLETELHIEPHFRDEIDNQSREKKRHTIEEWRNKLAELCGQYTYGTGKKLLIMLDASDQLVQDESRDKLYYIPKNVGENIHFMMTSTPDLLTEGRRFRTLKKIDETEKRAVIEGTLTKNIKELSEPVIEKMVSMKASDNPLFLSLLVQRLVMMDAEDFNAIHAKGDGIKAIESYQIELIETQCPDDLEKMSAALLLEAGRKINPGLVSRTGKFLAVSRFGLRRADLDVLIGELWTEVDFAHFVSYMNDCFMLRDDGRYDFTHKSIRAGFLALCENIDLYNRRILEHLKLLPDNDPVRIAEIIYHTIKADDKKFFVGYISNININNSFDAIDCASNDIINQFRDDNGEWLCSVLSDFDLYKDEIPPINIISFVNLFIINHKEYLFDTPVNPGYKSDVFGLYLKECSQLADNKRHLKIKVLTSCIDLWNQYTEKTNCFGDHNERRLISMINQEIADLYGESSESEELKNARAFYLYCLSYFSHDESEDIVNKTLLYAKIAVVSSKCYGKHNLNEAILYADQFYSMIIKGNEINKSVAENYEIDDYFEKVAEIYIESSNDVSLDKAVRLLLIKYDNSKKYGLTQEILEYKIGRLYYLFDKKSLSLQYYTAAYNNLTNMITKSCCDDIELFYSGIHHNLGDGTSVLLGRINESLGDIDLSLGKYSEALEYYLRARAIYYNYCFWSSEDFPDLLISIGKTLYECGERYKYKKYYEKAFNIYSRMNDTFNKYSMMSFLAKSLDDYALAVDCLIRSIKIAEKDDTREETIIYLYCRLSNLYADTKRFRNSDCYLEKAVTLFDNIQWDKENRKYADSCFEIGYTMKKRKKYKKALAFLKQELEFRKIHCNDDYFKLSRAYYNVGLLCWNTGDKKTASEYVSRAVKQFEAIFPENNISLAKIFVSYGRILSCENHNVQAEKYINNALSIFKNTFAKANEKTYNEPYRVWSKICFCRGRIFGGIKNYCVSFRILRILFEMILDISLNMQVIRADKNVGKGQFVKAIGHYEKALSILEIKNTKDKFYLEYCWKKLEKIYNQLDIIIKANEYKEKIENNCIADDTKYLSDFSYNQLFT